MATQLVAGGTNKSHLTGLAQGLNNCHNDGLSEYQPFCHEPYLQHYHSASGSAGCTFDTMGLYKLVLMFMLGLTS